MSHDSKKKEIGVLILGGIRLYRDGLAQLLPGEHGLQVVATAAETAQALVLIRELSPSVVLLDLGTAGSLGIAQAIKAEGLPTKIVGLAVDDLDRNVVDFARAGVSGFVTREGSVEDLIAAVRSADAGELICSPRIAAKLLSAVAKSSRPLVQTKTFIPTLTAREMEVLSLIEKGLSNKEIANRLCISLPTVKNHVHNLLEKLRVRRRGEAVARIRSDRPIFT